MMMNPKLNLYIPINKSLTNLQDPGPFTPLDQTLKTPIEPQGFNYIGQSNIQNGPYAHPHYNESDDILVDTDESASKYTLNFTPHFDQLLLTVYNRLLSLPTTTPFTGTIPPSGLVSKVANETMANLSHLMTTSNSAYDTQQILTTESLKNGTYQPIFLQLIRKRLIELCSNKQSTKLPSSTCISLSSVSSSTSINGLANTNPGPSNAHPYGWGRQSSISNLSLTDFNVNNYQSRSRSSSNNVNLRKQSLTRNNSNNNWLHVGNLNTIKTIGVSSSNELTDSLQSMQDFVPQSFINRLANTPTQPGFNPVMMDVNYQTPPTSNKSSFSTPPSIHPPQQIHFPVQPPTRDISVVHQSTPMEFDDFNFNPKTSNRNVPLTINTDNTTLQQLHDMNTLDSPFMALSHEYQQMGHSNQFNISESLEISKISLNEKKRDSLNFKRGIH